MDYQVRPPALNPAPSPTRNPITQRCSTSRGEPQALLRCARAQNKRGGRVQLHTITRPEVEYYDQEKGEVCVAHSQREAWPSDKRAARLACWCPSLGKCRSVLLVLRSVRCLPTVLCELIGKPIKRSA